jgi:REP element-mobilizing transposase RayT
MARQARIKDNYGVYYITQHSSGCRPLFESDDDRTVFIDILQKAVNKFNCKILDYCAQDNSQYHLIIDVNKGDLSKIMKSINIPYAMYAKCDGKLFKDRYKSRPMIDSQDIEATRSMIAEAIKTNGGFSSFCVSEIIPCSEPVDTHCVECISCKNEAYLKLNEIAKDSAMSVEYLLKDKELRNQLIRDFRKTSTLSLKAIGEVFGGLSESSVSKIISN